MHMSMMKKSATEAIHVTLTNTFQHQIEIKGQMHKLPMNLFMSEMVALQYLSRY